MNPVRSLLLFVLMLLPGCSADQPLNPSFPLLLADAKVSLKEMAADPRPLTRPVVVLGGIFDPGIAAPGLSKKLRQLTTDDKMIISISFFGEGSFDACRAKVIERVLEAFGSEDSDQTVEVDVVAVSMGGLVARHAAQDIGDGRPRLKIKRLFTISTPHRGAKLAGIPTFDRRIMDMRPDSEFLKRLTEDGSEPGYLIIPYVRLGDAIVGEANAAPKGLNPWWVANPPINFSHLMVMFDPRFHADIARRLRGEKPFTTEPAGELPQTEPGK